MVYDDSLQKHIRCKKGDIAKYVLIPGDPGRAKRIADRFDSAEKMAVNREYTVYTGEKDDVRLSVCSTGIGGPSAAIAVEELAELGADTFIRVGSAGGRRKDMPVGSVAVVNSAYRGDGTSFEYLPANYPAVADHQITAALINAAEELNQKIYVGGSYTRDAYYMQNKELNEELLNTQMIVSEMECSACFIVGAKRNLRVGAVVGTDSNIIKKEQFNLETKDKLFKEAEAKAIDIAIKAVLNLAVKEK